MVDVAARAAGNQPGARLIAADVGGTYARLGLVGVDAGGGISVLFHRRYPCAVFAGLAAILRRFREECEAAQAGPFPVACVVAIAGVLQGDQLLNSNLPWKVSLAETRREAGIAQLHLINDFEALAWALPQVPADQLQVLGAGDGNGCGSVGGGSADLGEGGGLGGAHTHEAPARESPGPLHAPGRRWRATLAEQRLHCLARRVVDALLVDVVEAGDVAVTPRAVGGDALACARLSLRDEREVLALTDDLVGEEDDGGGGGVVAHTAESPPLR